uniref:Uncharacterized protein n=1 Tax=Sinocyclocheilus rhinocerous TaxID=307959 RepID=A0A673K808_9TELE
MTGEKIRSVRKERKAGLDLLEPDEEPAATGPTKANRGSKILSGSNHKILRSSSQQNQNHGDRDINFGNTPLHLAVMMGHKGESPASDTPECMCECE